MLLGLESSWLMMVVATVAIVAYIFSLGMDALMKSDGFGPIGNAVVIGTGFFLAILSANAYGIRFDGLIPATLTGLAGAFAVFMTMALVKAGLERI